jgi:divalent metal cation (Fe/Co/Zn/Cd) transporter
MPPHKTRGRTDDIYVDLHVLVNPTMHVDQAHKISSDIENTMKKQISGVSDVVVHIEPREHEKNHD